MRQKFIVTVALCLAQLAIVHSASATFPDRPVRLIVTSPPGGPPDIMARLLSDEISKALGQPLVVENRAGGAGGIIGAKFVLGTDPDGYTLLMGSTSTLLTSPAIYKDAGYTAASFAPVAGLSETPEVLTVSPSIGAHTVADLVRVAKEKPGTLHFGSAGIGSLPHLEGELLKVRAGIDMVHVPYRGGGPALVGLLGGEVQVFFSALTQMLPYILDGRLNGLAVTSASRSELAPNIPTMQESGFDQFVTASVNFLVAPPETPLPVRQRISDAVASALASGQVKDAFAKMGAKAQPATPAQLVPYLAQQQKRWTDIVATTHISAEQ
jgi:tripartite-type tricarboxylate transporter receptor subunit TctC